MADARQPRRSTPAASAKPAASTARSADDAEIVDLIAGVRSARINLTADLAAAAGAVDAEQFEVARDILDAERADLAAFVADARQSLNEQTSHRLQPDPAIPAPRRPRRTRSRVLIALPAVPLVGALAMSAAVAIGAGYHHSHRAAAVTQHLTRNTASTPSTSMLPSAQPTAADTTLHRLEHVVTHHPQAAQVLAVASDLHAQLTQMIASSKNDPQQLGVVRRLLVLEQHVLEINNAPGSTAALAASRAIAQLLELVPSTRPSPHPAATATPSPNDAQSSRNSSPSAHATTTKVPTPATSTAPKHHRHASPQPTTSPKKWPNPLFGPGVFNNFL